MRVRDTWDVWLARVNLGEVERIDEVTHVFTAPGIHLFHMERLAMHLSPLLHEQSLALVSRMFGKHTAFSGEWRSDVERHTETGTRRLPAKLAVEWILHPFARLVPRCQRAKHVVSPATCFVVRDDQSRVVPALALHE